VEKLIPGAGWQKLTPGKRVMDFHETAKTLQNLRIFSRAQSGCMTLEPAHLRSEMSISKQRGRGSKHAPRKERWK